MNVETAVLPVAVASGTWLDALAGRAAAVDPSGWEPGVPHPVDGEPRMSGVLGGVAERGGEGMPGWGYVLIVRSDGSQVVKRGLPPVDLAAGMVVGFEALRRHRLVQSPRSCTIWIALGVREEIGVDEAARRIRDEFEPG